MIRLISIVYGLAGFAFLGLSMSGFAAGIINCLFLLSGGTLVTIAKKLYATT